MLNIQNKKSFYQLLFVFILTALAYSNIFPNKFLSFEIQNPQQLKVLFTLSFLQQNLFLLGEKLAKALSFLIGSAFFNFHLFSIFLHLTNVFMVYKIVRKISSKEFIAFLAALFFSIHPAQTEAVTHVTSFMILLGSLGLLGSFYWFLKSLEHKSGGINRYQLMSMVGILLTSLFFRQALIFPVLIFSYMTLSQKTRKEALYKSAPYGVVSGLILLMVFLGQFNDSTVYLYENFYLNALVAIKAFGRYLITALVPMELSYNPALSEGISARFPEDFDAFAFLSQSVIDLPVLITLLLLCILYYCFFKRIGRKNPLVIFGGIWFVISLIPGLSIWPTRIFYSESFLYISNFGFALILALLFSPLLESLSIQKGKDFLVWIVFITMVLFGVVQSWMRNLDWRNDKNFYSAAVQVNPQSYLMKLSLAKSYIHGLDSEKGIALLKEMIQHYPQKSEIYVLLAEGYKNFNQYKNAVSMLEQAIAIDPENADAYFKLSEIYALWEIYQPAYQNLDRAVYYFKKQGRLKEAERIESILKQYADNPESFNPPKP